MNPGDLKYSKEHEWLRVESDGSAVVVAMHDLTLAAQFCDRIVNGVERHYARSSKSSNVTFSSSSRALVVTLPIIASMWKGG